MKQSLVALNGTYRLKAELKDVLQADSSPFLTRDVTIVRIKFPAGRKTAWFYDVKGNAFRSKDFAERTPTIDVEEI